MVGFGEDAIGGDNNGDDNDDDNDNNNNNNKVGIENMSTRRNNDVNKIAKLSSQNKNISFISMTITAFRTMTKITTPDKH